MLHTTLALLRQHDACVDRYRHLREVLGPEYGDETPIPLLRILEINRLDDALWALRAVTDEQAVARDRLARLFACDCAERVLPLFEQRFPADTRPRQAIATARRFAHGDATAAELADAWAAAWAAAGEDAGDAAWAAGDAAWAAARDAAWAAAGDAAWAAAWAAAGEAAGEAAWDAGDAAWAAARDAARDAAWAAERSWQEQRFRKYLNGQAEGC